MIERFDVVIVGAGLSGVGAACHLRRESPDTSFVVLEGREAIGGTWDLFRYPGIRSDSDMFTFGYAFEPWRANKSIADGPSILEYIRTTAAKYGVDSRVRFKHRVTRAAWSSERAVWTLDIEREGHEPIRIEARFVWMCTGYYRYDAGYTPEFEGREQFGGTILHPQRWPDDLDYAGKRVVVIGSGATAVTLVPAMAEKAAHVTMLQRSPTYVLSRPAVDRMAERLQALLPEQLAHDLSRWKNVALGTTLYQLSKRRPEAMKRWLLGEVRKAVGPSVDVERHFSPKYGPWDERLCLVPDNDLFKVLRDGRASIVTDTVARFDATGIVLGSGERLDADVVVTATGLELLFLGGTELVVDGRTIEPHDHLTFKGMMFSDIPNLAFTAGYTNASWTLKADLIAEHVIRLLHTMRARGATTVTPRKPSDVEPAPFLDLRSGYILRAEKRFPTQGSKRPWKLYQNYLLDLLSLRHGRVDDPNLEFSQDR